MLRCLSGAGASRLPNTLGIDPAGAWPVGRPTLVGIWAFLVSCDVVDGGGAEAPGRAGSDGCFGGEFLATEEAAVAVVLATAEGGSSIRPVAGL